MKRNAEHFYQWFETSREQVKALRREMPEMSKKDKLLAIRARYVRLAHIRKVCTDKAYFVGAPKTKLSDLSNDS